MYESPTHVDVDEVVDGINDFLDSCEHDEFFDDDQYLSFIWWLVCIGIPDA